ncbi:hypothetical protein V1279_001869 [Bradyrhizobium sp. AZCC 1610]|uniref:hypothetical protein n=1 Tax=Bradyrhizobium sp. AZCC 1610 TaxID=3117020 RepID=UPI002FEE869F
MARKGHAPDSLVAAAKASLAEPLESAGLGRAITRFLTQSSGRERGAGISGHPAAGFSTQKGCLKTAVVLALTLPG